MFFGVGFKFPFFAFFNLILALILVGFVWSYYNVTAAVFAGVLYGAVSVFYRNGGGRGR